jgi:hypothetical protein
MDLGPTNGNENLPLQRTTASRDWQGAVTIWANFKRFFNGASFNARQYFLETRAQLCG